MREVHGPQAVGDLLEADGIVFERITEEQELVAKRNVPAAMISRTRKGPGYSIAGTTVGYGRSELR